MGVRPSPQRPVEPIPSPTGSQIEAPRAPQLRIMTINVNAWSTFREKWATAGEFREFDGSTAILIQEHKLQGRDQCRDAEEWCGRRGWHATFSSAITLPSGQPSGGVAILVAQRPDLGVVDCGLHPGDWGHRILGLRISVPGADPFLLASIYLQANGGMNETNRALLSQIAQWQEQMQQPVIAGGDYNVKTELLHRAGFPSRAQMATMAPAEPTYQDLPDHHHHRLFSGV